MKSLIQIIFLFVFIANIQSVGQDYIFFDDSPDNTFYDWSWGFVNAPSELERVGEKCPVDVDHVYAGINALRLHWTSSPGGDWGMAIAAIGTPWPTWNVTLKDTLNLWAMTEEAMVSSALPIVYLEDNTNKKTTKHKLADYQGDLVPNEWTKISVPLNIFQPGPQGADLTIIKTIFFGQDPDVNDATEHTLYLDEIRMISESTGNDTIPPATPTGVIAKGSDKHIDVMWDFNNEEDLDSYNIYRLEGQDYILAGVASKDDRFFTDYVGDHGISHTYKVSAYDWSSNESELSDEVTAATSALTDEELLTMLQESTFRYFWDYAHPVSGLSRERYASGNTCTIGGSGFGVMAILVGIERGFITREEGVERMLTILTFLANTADKFHGVWSHWLNGETGAVIPFSANDDGGDLVESAFMIQALLTARKYFNGPAPEENVIRILITGIWEDVEWDWYRREPTSNFLYWHWSPNHGWVMNFPLIGWNETMITYLLAIASPTHSIPASMYHDGWASSSSYVNGSSYYGFPLYVGWPYGGPLFFAHYSFLAFDPREKRDDYANYYINNRNHTLINRAYCIANPAGFAGYGENTWGLTACDNPWGYLAHEPFNHDNGTIAPTAALSSMPYTPTESIAAFKNFYDTYGENLWGIYGFKDAFNLEENWFATSFLAIDQGPIIVMVENYRSELLWNNFMANEEIQPMLDAIGFIPDSTTDVGVDTELPLTFELFDNYPNPFNPETTIKYSIRERSFVTLKVFDVLGKEVALLINEEISVGTHSINWSVSNLSSGVYFYELRAIDPESRSGQFFVQTKKMIFMK